MGLVFVGQDQLLRTGTPQMNATLNSLFSNRKPLNHYFRQRKVLKKTRFIFPRPEEKLQGCCFFF